LNSENRKEAAAKAKKRWGKSYAIRNSGHMSSPEMRQSASLTVRTARAEMNRIEEEIQSRLKDCDWYQELRGQQREQRERIRKTEGTSMHYRFSVGSQNGLFFSVQGQGDTWEEAFQKADSKS
jgi:hypothetical protein